ncbi:MAG: hypothetical protein RR135_06505, partial [Oscillospiraceae bacterium]
MDLRKLKTLIDLVSESNVSELEITEAEGKVRIVKGGGVVVQQMMAQPMMAQPVAAAAAPVAEAAPAVAAAPAALPLANTALHATSQINHCFVAWPVPGVHSPDAAALAV